MASHRTGRSAGSRWHAFALGVCAAAAGCKSPAKAPVAAAASSSSDGATGAPAPARSIDAGDAGGAPDPEAFGASSGASQIATWTCTGNPCPWGSSLRNQALIWPAAVGAGSARLGYTVSAGVYLPAARAGGADISIQTGAATIHAGLPDQPSHRVLATLAAGETFHVTGLARGEVVSVQADAPFTYVVTLPSPAEPERREPERREPERRKPERRKPEPRDPGAPRGPVVHAIAARWRCNHTPGCFSDPWPGSVIAWPSWAANQSNGRTGNVLRFVYSTRGEPLYPYMGPWAQGCEVTAVSGTAKVVEWKRGSEQWRQTVLQPGQAHVIALVPPEDGALIEGPGDSSTFSVSLDNCTPQRIEP